jgi:F0F1-type ATP synthase membrane subunit c/vacuolar-type H+-ATPase subunit K
MPGPRALVRFVMIAVGFGASGSAFAQGLAGGNQLDTSKTGLAPTYN